MHALVRASSSRFWQDSSHQPPKFHFMNDHSVSADQTVLFVGQIWCLINISVLPLTGLLRLCKIVESFPVSEDIICL